MSFDKHSALNHLLYSKITIFLLLVVVIWLGKGVWDRFQVERDTFLKRVEVESELRTLKDRRDVLEARVIYLEEERGVEAEIRRNFDVAREGETMVVLLNSPATSSESKEIAPIHNINNKKPWWRFWD